VEKKLIHVGLLPFRIKSNKIEYMVFSFSEDEEKNLLICKGKRLIKDPITNNLREIENFAEQIDENLLEDKEVAVRREAYEEMGLKVSDRQELLDLGVTYHSIVDRRSGAYSKLYINLFGIDVSNEDISKHISGGQVAGKKTFTKWVSYREYKTSGRVDYITIMDYAHEILCEVYNLDP
jgi:8-oxo-dGTP pyrophosphatase MutT (NUDIX family)